MTITIKSKIKTINVHCSANELEAFPYTVDLFFFNGELTVLRLTRQELYELLEQIKAEQPDLLVT